MWDYSSIEDNFKKRTGKLDKKTFNFLRQEIDSVRFYSKCLDGSSYVYSDDLNNIYDLQFRDYNTYKISSEYSTYYNGGDADGIAIDRQGNSDLGFYNRYKNDYGYTVKNLFSPKRLFNYTNYYNVDLATTQPIDFDLVDDKLTIDGEIVIIGQRILVKDNISTVTLDSSIDAETFLNTDVTVVQTIGGQITYQYSNNENGVYRYDGLQLIRENDLDTVDNVRNYSVYVKLGSSNITKSFHLNRLTNGAFPLITNNENISFTEKNDYVIRNSVDYRNVLDNNFATSLAQLETVFSFRGNTYDIPNRNITVGDFGLILNYQNNYMNIVKNRFKEDLKDIIELNNKYLIVGNNGTLLSMDKVYFDLSIIEIDSIEDLLSIDIRNGKGIIVGSNGSILTSINNNNWNELDNPIENNINAVQYFNLAKANYIGNNGVFGEVNVSGDQFKITEKELTIRPNLFDERIIRDDLHNINNVEIENQFFKYTGADWVDIPKDINSSFSFDFSFKPTDLEANDTQVLFSITPTPSATQSAVNIKGFKVFIEKENNDYRLRLSITDPNGNEVKLDGDISLSNDKWYKVFITRFKNEYEFFVNNRLGAETALGFDSNFDNFNDTIRLGAELTYDFNNSQYLTASYNNFIGTIDNVRLWDKRLDNQEVFSYGNYYSDDLPNLVTWYKFKVTKNASGDKIILTNDVVDNRSLSLPSNSNITFYNANTSATAMLEIELFKGTSIIGDNIIVFDLEDQSNYSDITTNTQFYITFDNESPKNLRYYSTDGYYYGVSDQRSFRIDSFKLDFNLLNYINDIEVELEPISNKGYDNLSINFNLQELLLIGSVENNEIDKIDLNNVCVIQPVDRLEGCTISSTVSIIDTTNSIDIENDYKDNVTDEVNVCSINYIKALGFPSSTQSVCTFYVPNGDGQPFDLYQEVYLVGEVEDQLNGYFEVSFNGVDFEEIRGNGEFIVPLGVGADSSLTFRTRLAEGADGNKVKGLIKNLKVYDNCVRDLFPEQYTGNAVEVKKLYFSQFDKTTEVDKITASNYLYSYIDLKSLQINNIEEINLATYQSEGFPVRLFESQVVNNALVNCQNTGLCSRSTFLTNNTIDRIQYGLGLSLSLTGDDYVYNNTSYNLLEPLTLTNVQLFGIDDHEVGGLNSPYHIGFDISKNFYFEVDSVIITEEDLLNSDITNGAYITQSVEMSATSSLGSGLAADVFNQIVFTGSLATYSVLTDVTLNENSKYLLELEIDGDLDFTFGTNSYSVTGSNTFVSQIVEVNQDSDFIVMKANSNTTITNLVVSDRVPTKSFIKWDTETCDLTYKLSGVSVEEGFIQSDGERFLPQCVLQQDCDITVESIVNTQYWEDYDPKLLFLNYDVANKLYFFDLETGEYQLPQNAQLFDVRELTIESLSGEKSWLDYVRDTTKEFLYAAVKSTGNTVPWSNSFILCGNITSYTLTLNTNTTNDLSEINGVASGLLPNYATGSTISIGVPPVSKDVYLYKNAMVIKIPTTFDIEIGDVIKFTNSLIDINLITIDLLDDGGNTYAYFKTGFDDYLISRLVSWTKTTTITNLNRFKDIDELLLNFNLHPISIGYTLSEINGGVELSPKYNYQTAYYNLQCNISVRNNDLIVTDTQMRYRDKVTLFDYSPNYSILSYLTKDSRFDASFKLRSLPEYNFPNNNSGVLYTLSTGEISFNSSLKAEWESIPIYTFIDLVYDTASIRSVLIMSKNYDEVTERYIIKTYDYYDDVIQQSDLTGANFNLRVRNTLGEISEDLKKLDNIQRVESDEYDITNLNATIFSSYKNLKSDLNFKPYTDSYAKAFLSQKEIKEYLSGIVYTDFNNNLAMNIINLTKDDYFPITGISKYYIDCEDCVHDNFISFDGFNQFSYFGAATSSTNRVPFETYGFNNQIQVFGATGATFVDIPLNYATQSGTSSRMIEFDIQELENATIELRKGGTSLTTISRVPNEITKVQFISDDTSDLLFRINYDPENRTVINDIRAGDIECLDNCYLTTLRIPDHGLQIGDEFTVKIEDDIFELVNLYESDFAFATQSGWVQNVNGVETAIPLLNGQIDDYSVVNSVDSIYYDQPIGVTVGRTYRISFDYSMFAFGGGTPSLDVAFGATPSPTFNTVINELSVANNQRVETNFIATTSSIYVGFNTENPQILTLRNITVDDITNRSKYYDGRQIAFDVLNEDVIVIDTDYIGDVVETSATYTAINPCGKKVIRERITSLVGTISVSEFDPYLNYEPIDLYDLGNDNKIKYPTEINDINWNINDEVVNITGIDNNPYRFRLIDNLTFDEILDKYPWLLEAEIRNAVIGKDQNGLVWYKGTWDCGRWLGGTWYSGTWKTGVWYNGTWFNSRVTTDNNSATIDVIDAFGDYSVWKGGTWFNGTKKGGRWESGDWFDGTWEKGDWLGGTWRGGTWIDGNFKRGNWFDGTWTKGTFNSDFGLSRWFDGNWLRGDFENGIWFKGRFESIGAQSTFGNRATLSRKAIWENGFMVAGTVNSGDNSRHDLTVWKTGRANFLLWNGGTMFQNNINNCVWQDGVVKDIDILAFYGDNTGDYYFIVDGEYRFEDGNNFWVINNDTYNPIYGADTTPNRYTVDLDYLSLDNGRLTKVYVSNLPSALLAVINNNGSYVEGFSDNNNPVDTEVDGTILTKLVSEFSKTSWFNGRIENCIFDDRFIRSVYWENGYFKSGDFGF